LVVDTAEVKLSVLVVVVVVVVIIVSRQRESRGERWQSVSDVKG